MQKKIQIWIYLLIIQQDLARYNFDKAVVACGAFSKKLTDQLDEKIPLDTERGYHVHFKGYEW